MKQRYFAFFAVGLLMTALTSVALLFFSGPASVRSPQYEHAHFRMQLIVNGAPINFGDDAFQKEYSGSCSGEVAPEPFHFHDHKDQMVHVHWKHMSGGILLKSYGWNFVGGMSKSLGYRFDDFPRINRVPLYGKVLPAWPKDAQLWVYTGDENGFSRRSAKAFLFEDFESFFGVKSNVNAGGEQSALGRLLMPRAYAHQGETHADDQMSLEEINNLIGNVVIFAQKDQPTAEQVQARFKHLLPLSASTCGG